MKKHYAIVICALGLFAQPSQAQILKQLGSSVLKEVVNSVVPGVGDALIETPLSLDQLAGTWNFATPAVKLGSDNALTKIAANAATSEMSKKMNNLCSKLGIVDNTFKYTFNADSTFTNEVLGKTLKGVYSVDSTTNIIELSYQAYEMIPIATLRVEPVIENEQLSLLFESNSLLTFLETVTSTSEKNAFKMVNQLAKKCNSMKIGFDFKK